MKNVITRTRHTEPDALSIHQQLHSKEIGSVIEVDLKRYVIYKSTNGCKAVNVEGDVFMEQNVMKRSKWADMANQGHKITWIIPSDSSHWGRIVDNKVEILI